MGIVKQILAELFHRKMNAALAALSIAAAVALCVAFFAAAEASQRETTRITRDIGFNLRIIAKDTDLDRFWSEGFSDRTLPGDAAERLAGRKGIFEYYNHLVATLERRLEIGGGEAVLCGLAPAITAPAQRGQPMGFAIPAGRLYLGHRVARRLGVKQGDPLAIGGRAFAVDRVLAECGTDEDIKVFGLLSDVQRILGLEGRISEIKAIDCICRTGDRDPLAILRAELEEALPEAQVVQLRSMAEARARQRLMAERYASFGLALLLVLSAAIVCCLAVLNVRERRGEIGILRALGHRSGRIAALILGRALVVGGIGALVGAVSGSAVASAFGREVFRVTAGAVRAEPAILLVAAIAAPAFAALASAIPTVLAVTQDPATTLREV